MNKAEKLGIGGFVGGLISFVVAIVAVVLHIEVLLWVGIVSILVFFFVFEYGYHTRPYD